MQLLHTSQYTKILPNLRNVGRLHTVPPLHHPQTSAHIYNMAFPTLKDQWPAVQSDTRPKAV